MGCLCVVVVVRCLVITWLASSSHHTIIVCVLLYCIIICWNSIALVLTFWCYVLPFCCCFMICSCCCVTWYVAYLPTLTLLLFACSGVAFLLLDALLLTYLFLPCCCLPALLLLHALMVCVRSGYIAAVVSCCWFLMCVCVCVCVVCATHQKSELCGDIVY